MAQPTKKQYVEVLMRYVRKERRTGGNDTTSPPVNVSYVVYVRPRRKFCKNPNGLVSFQKNRGYTNPFNHLISCYKRKEDLFTEARRFIATGMTQNLGLLFKMYSKKPDQIVRKLFIHTYSSLSFAMHQFHVLKMSITASSRSSMQDSAESTLLNCYMN